MIEVKHLTKQYGSHVAVCDLSFTLESGKVYGLLGPNGAGKSTTMHMLTGYLGPSSGEVFVEGHSMEKEPKAAKEQIGFLPDIPPVYGDMTLGEYLLTVAELKGLPRQEKKSRIRQVMDQVKVADMERRLVKNLSKGYRQRVGLAQAMLGNPKNLILDEPMSGLDPGQILEIRSLIRAYAKECMVLISSHILPQISVLCDDVLILNQGRLIAQGRAADLEAMERGAAWLELLAEGEAASISSLLEALPFPVQKEIREQGRGLCQVKLWTDTEEDIRRDIFFAFAHARCPILEMRQHSKTLEEVFLAYTGEEKLS